MPTKNVFQLESVKPALACHPLLEKQRWVGPIRSQRWPCRGPGERRGGWRTVRLQRRWGLARTGLRASTSTRGASTGNGPTDVGGGFCLSWYGLGRQVTTERPANSQTLAWECRPLVGLGRRGTDQDQAARRGDRRFLGRGRARGPSGAGQLKLQRPAGPLPDGLGIDQQLQTGIILGPTAQPRAEGTRWGPYWGGRWAVQRKKNKNGTHTAPRKSLVLDSQLKRELISIQRPGRPREVGATSSRWTVTGPTGKHG